MNRLMRTATMAMLGSALGAALGGCTLHPGPALSVEDVMVRRDGGEGAVLVFRVRAENAGEEPLPLGPARYELTLDGSRAHAGMWLAQATAPAGGSITFDLPAPVEADSLPAPGERVAYTLSGSVDFVPPGVLAEALFDANIQRGTVRLVERGEFTLEAPARPPQGP